MEVPCRFTRCFEAQSLRYWPEPWANFTAGDCYRHVVGRDEAVESLLPLKQRTVIYGQMVVAAPLDQGLSSLRNEYRASHAS